MNKHHALILPTLHTRPLSCPCHDWRDGIKKGVVGSNAVFLGAGGGGPEEGKVGGGEGDKDTEGFGIFGGKGTDNAVIEEELGGRLAGARGVGELDAVDVGWADGEAGVMVCRKGRTGGSGGRFSAGGFVGEPIGLLAFSGAVPGRCESSFGALGGWKEVGTYWVVLQPPHLRSSAVFWQTLHAVML